MNSGSLRERLTFQTKTEATDGMGAGGTATWADTLTGVPASVWPIKGTEVIDSLKLEQRIDYRVRVRYQSEINSAMRIKWTNLQGTIRYLDIIDGPRDLRSNSRELEMLVRDLDA